MIFYFTQPSFDHPVLSPPSPTPNKHTLSAHKVAKFQHMHPKPLLQEDMTPLQVEACSCRLISRVGSWNWGLYLISDGRRVGGRVLGVREIGKRCWIKLIGCKCIQCVGEIKELTE